MSVFVNTTFQGGSETAELMNELQLSNIIFNRYIANKKLNFEEADKVDIIYRSLQILSKLDYENLNLLKRNFLAEINKYLNEYSKLNGFSNHVIRIWV